MNDVVDLQGQPARLEENHEFVADLCRYAEGQLTEAAVRKKYHFDNDAWEKLGEDDALVEAIEAEKIRRIRDGSSKREKAQQLVTRAPDVLGKIMDDDNQSARHRIDSAKVLNDFASNGPASAEPSDRFIITINLGEDVIRFNKSIKPTPHDIDPDVDTGVIAAIAAKKLPDGGNGEPI